MEELKPLGMGDVVKVLQDFYGQSMLEMANRPPIAPFNIAIRNQAFYAPQPEEINPETHCIHCGHSLEDPDY